jgi:hypothetical protein
MRTILLPDWRIHEGELLVEYHEDWRADGMKKQSPLASAPGEMRTIMMGGLGSPCNQLATVL